jgi:hypothetical protein
MSARFETTGPRKKIGGKTSLLIFACRSCSVVSRRTVAELLQSLAVVMAERDLPWYLFGAQAAIIWGSPRLSADVDVTATIEPSAVNAFVSTMKQHGFLILQGDPDFVARTRVLPFVHRDTHMPLDVVLGGRGLEEDFLRRAIPVHIGPARIPVISPEDLIITKVLAGRPKDIEDVRAVIHERRASLDEQRVRQILHLLEEALGQSDLLPLFERIWNEEPSKPLRRSKRPRRKLPSR